MKCFGKITVLALSLCFLIAVVIGLALVAHAENEYTTLAVGGLRIDGSSFPDSAFREYVGQNCDTNRDGYLSDGEISAVTEIVLDGKTVRDLSGIGVFTKLERLFCSGNNIGTVNLSSNKAIVELICDNSGVSSLDVSGCASLVRLVCDRNSLTSINLSGKAALRELVCNMNPLQSLNLSGCTALERLECFDCTGAIRTLNVSGSTALRYLDCSGSNVSALKVSGLRALEILKCDGNALTSLDVSGCTSIGSLNCENNSISSLNAAGCSSLFELRCGDNRVASLSLSGCAALGNLHCGGNELASVNISYCPALTYVDLSDNMLSSLDVSGNKQLLTLLCRNNKLARLDVSKNTVLSQLDCSKNLLTSLDISRCRVRYLDCSGLRIDKVKLNSGCETIFCAVADIKNDGGIYRVDLSDVIENKYISTIGNSVYDPAEDAWWYDTWMELWRYDKGQAAFAAKDNSAVRSYFNSMGTLSMAPYFYLTVSDGKNVWKYRVTAELSVRLPGDVDGDGAVTNADALAIFRYIFDPKMNPLDDTAAADLDGDGKISNADALFVFRCIFDPELYPIK